jgi:hypothetical protein
MNRKNANPKTELARPVRIFITDHQMAAAASPTRLPTASRTIPPINHVMAYEI